MQGLMLEKKYEWSKLPNNRYVIYNVPIFQIYNDEKRGAVTIEDAKEILFVFEKDRKTGYYPRAHIEHQLLGSRPAAGFIDHLRFDNIQNKFFADIVEIPESIFFDIQNLKYPYRSVEYDLKRKKIVSLAFLESQAPFFQFPILALEDKARVLTNFQKYLYEKRLCFQKGDIMPDEIITEETPVEEVEKPETEGLEAKLDKLIETLTPLLENLPKILEFIESLEVEEGGGVIAETPEPVAMQKYQVAKLSSVADMQNFIENRDKLLFAEMDKRLKQLEARKADSLFEERLKNLCEKNPYVNFKAESEILQKFSSIEDKEIYIKKLEVQNMTIPVHTATNFARNFKMIAQNKVLQKFQNESISLQRVAAKAYRDYQDTINQKNERAARQFANAWPQVEKFVEYAIELEREEQGSYDREFGR